MYIHTSERFSAQLFCIMNAVNQGGKMDSGSGVGSNSKPGRSCSFPDTCHVGPGASGQLTAMKKPIFYILLFFINHSF